MSELQKLQKDPSYSFCSFCSNNEAAMGDSRIYRGVYRRFPLTRGRGRAIADTLAGITAEQFDAARSDLEGQGVVVVDGDKAFFPGARPAVPQMEIL